MGTDVACRTDPCLPSPMQQTLFALAAILSFAYLSLGRQRHDNDVERRAIEIEAARAASDVVQLQMTAMERLAFDEADTGIKGIRTVESELDLGPDYGESSTGEFDDVDDWDEFEAVVAVPAGRDSLRFTLSVDVQYVENRQPSKPSTSHTLTKEILVSAVEVMPAAADRPPTQARLRRVVTPASVSTYIHQNS